jgi:hypothetical protein
MVLGGLLVTEDRQFSDKFTQNKLNGCFKRNTYQNVSLFLW